MDARLTDEQSMLRDTVARVAAEIAPRSPADLPPAHGGNEEWMRLAGTGLLGMRLPEVAGGTPASGVEVVLAAEELGRRVVALPFVSSAVYSSSLLAAAGASVDLLGSLCDGSLRCWPRSWTRHWRDRRSWASRGWRGRRAAWMRPWSWTATAGEWWPCDQGDHG